MLDYNIKAREEIIDYIKGNFSSIEVRPGKCRYNFRCHDNAVHEASKKNHKKIALCVYIDNGWPIIHFINYNKKKFRDNTLGQWASQYEYYLIRFIEAKDMWNVHHIFEEYRKELGRKLNWKTRILSNYRG